MSPTWVVAIAVVVGAYVLANALSAVVNALNRTKDETAGQLYTIAHKLQQLTSTIEHRFPRVCSGCGNTLAVDEDPQLCRACNDRYLDSLKLSPFARLYRSENKYKNSRGATCARCGKLLGYAARVGWHEECRPRSAVLIFPIVPSKLLSDAYGWYVSQRLPETFESLLAGRAQIAQEIDAERQADPSHRELWDDFQLFIDRCLASTNVEQEKVLAVSPHYDISKLQSGDIEDKIDVFVDQMNGWLIAHAHALASDDYPNSQHTGFAILSLIGSYFEAIASFLTGESSEGKSTQFFGIGFRAVFPEFESQVVARGFADVDAELKRLSDAYYREVRCGLFHEAMVRAGTVIVKGTGLTLQVAEEPSSKKLTFEIEPFQLLRRVQKHFDDYITNLRRPTEVQLRTNFEREWDRRTSG
jgi:hypothetical protein